MGYAQLQLIEVSVLAALLQKTALVNILEQLKSCTQEDFVELKSLLQESGSDAMDQHIRTFDVQSAMIGR